MKTRILDGSQGTARPRKGVPHKYHQFYHGFKWGVYNYMKSTGYGMGEDLTQGEFSSPDHWVEICESDGYG